MKLRLKITLSLVALLLALSISLMWALNVSLRYIIEKEAYAMVDELVHAELDSMGLDLSNRFLSYHYLYHTDPRNSKTSPFVKLPAAEMDPQALPEDEAPFFEEAAPEEALKPLPTLQDIERPAPERYQAHEELLLRTYLDQHPELYQQQGVLQAEIQGLHYTFARLSSGPYHQEGGDWIYVSTSSALRLLSTIHWIFALVLLFFSTLSILIGLRFGRRLEDSERRFKSFFENASHELKTPIMSIQGYAEALEKGVITDCKEATTVILEESDRMASLVDELLTLARIESGVMQPSMEACDLNEIVHHTLADFQFVVNKAGLTLHPPSASEPPRLVHGNEAQITKALRSVLENALRYAEKNITLHLHKEGKDVVLQIHDDGPGIPKDDLPHLFDRFYSGEQGNTGIGLSLAKQILQMHQGSIKAWNLPAGGACFSLRFPLSKAPSKQRK